MSTALVPTNGNSRPMLSDEQKQLIRDTFANGASEAEFDVLWAVAKARNLNPLLRQVYFRKQWDSTKRRDVWIVMTSIDGLRATAERTGRYAGQDEPEFEYEQDGKGLRACKVRVYKTGTQRPFVGVAHWSEFVQHTKEGKVTSFWAGKPHIMLSKCAEALALRKAFPEDTSGLYIQEEMGVDPEAARPPPIRGRVRDSLPEPTTDDTLEQNLRAASTEGVASPHAADGREATPVAAAGPDVATAGNPANPPPDEPSDVDPQEALAAKLIEACEAGFPDKRARFTWWSAHLNEINELPKEFARAVVKAYDATRP